MSILLFLAVLFVLVLVHELGHFAVAKWTGMRVDEFGIGFPPKLFGIKRGETEYTFNLFPIGGFVKIAGEDAVLTGEGSADTEAFTSKSKWAQSAVLVAGVTMNILFAWLLIALAFGIGVQTSVSEKDASRDAVLAITNVLPGSPAEKASLSSGAVIKEVSVQGDALDTLTPTAFSSFVASHRGEAITLSYSLGGEMRIVQITPEIGIITDKPDQPAVGVALTQIDTVSRSFVDSILDSAVYVGKALRDITAGIVKLAVDAVMMRADFSQVAGPVGIVGLVGEASAFGLTSLLMFTAFISLNLAVINIFPFPALDGGRLLFVCIEVIKGSPIKAQYSAVLNTVGFVLLLILMVAVTWNDIARL
jgi:regulator of sigma E protease